MLSTIHTIHIQSYVFPSIFAMKKSNYVDMITIVSNALNTQPRYDILTTVLGVRLRYSSTLIGT